MAADYALTSGSAVAARPIPSPDVLAMFGLGGQVSPMPGGYGRCVRVGDAVLKPVDDPDEAQWVAEVMNVLPCNGFRVAQPLRAVDGRWVAAGWSASRWLPGVTGSAGRWHEVLAVGRAFHRATASLPRPDFITSASHAYAIADRCAWDEQEAVALRTPVRYLVQRLSERLRPVDAAAQIVHGDMSENILFAPGHAPAVIDFSPYWRPPAYADGIVIADALIWSDGLPELIDNDQTYQMTLRAMIFRLIGMHELTASKDLSREATPFGPVVDMLTRSRRWR